MSRVAPATRHYSRLNVTALTAGIMGILITAVVTPQWSLVSAYASKQTAIIQLDNTLPWYYAGVPITISGRVIPANASENMVIQVYNPRGNLYHAEPVSISDSGKFTTQFVIGGTEGMDGKYIVVATYEHEQSAIAIQSKHNDALAVGTVNNLIIPSGTNHVVQAGQILTLTGTTTIDGTLTIKQGAKVINHSVISGNGGTIVNDGTLKNTNTINLSCSISLTSTSLLLNNGKMVVSQSDSCNSVLRNSGILNNQGILEIVSTSQQAAIVNDRTINNLQYATFHVNGVLQNNDSINNIGELSTSGNTSQGTVNNSGSIRNYCGSIYQVGLSGNQANDECAV